MKTKKALGRALGVVGVILLGAVGSGLWETVFGPLLVGLRNRALDFTTLGLSSLKDTAYAQVASAFYRQQADPTQIPTALILIGTVVALYLVWSMVVKAAGDTMALSARHLGTEAERIMASFVWTRRVYSFLVLLLGILAFIVYLGLTIQQSYVNSAASHFRQVLAIAAPLLTDQEEEELEGRFAQLRTREEYLELIGEVERLAKDHDQVVPTFAAW